MALTHRGFSLVRFSPNPEEIEHVNVALLLWGGAEALHYRRDFPKLRCVAGDKFSTRLLESYLGYVSEQAHKISPLESHVVLSGLSAQVHVTPFRAAPQVAESKFIEWLEQRYLAAHEQAEPVPKHRKRPSIEKQLDLVLSRVLSRGDYMRRPKAKELLGSVSEPLFGREALRVARAFRGVHGLVLVDGLDLGADVSSIESRAGRLSYTFHRYATAKPILKASQQELRRIAMFIGATEPGDPKEAVRIWARDLLKRDADVIITEKDVPALRSEAQRVGAVLTASN